MKSFSSCIGLMLVAFVCLFVPQDCQANEITPLIDLSGLAVMGERPETLSSEPSFLASVSDPETVTVQDPEPTPAYEDVWVTDYQQVCIGGQCFQQPVRRLVRRAVQTTVNATAKTVDVVQAVAVAPVYAMESVVQTAVYRSDVAFADRQWRPLQRVRNRMAAFHQRRAMRLSR